MPTPATVLSAEERELLALLLKKANLSEADLVRDATARWVNKNLDLLTPQEKKRFSHVLLLKP